MNFTKTTHQMKEPILLNNFSIEVQNRYILKQNQKKREWFTKDIKFILNNDNFYFPELIIKFDHIDEDNPEFFLQPGQIIKIIKGKIELKQSSPNIYILTIYKFQQDVEK